MAHTAPLAVTMGDPAGIGPDITLMAWRARGERALPPFAVHADVEVLRARADQLGLPVPVTLVSGAAEAAAVFERALPVVSVTPCRGVVAGRPDPAHAAATIAAIDDAVAAVSAGGARAVVTNPIAKSVLYASGFRYPGHTEYLAALAGRAGGETFRPVMMLASDALKVVPVTIHIPLADVPGALTADLLLETIVITAAALKRDFGMAQPRIAVAGLNPHAGEDGTIGTQDRDLIAPVIAALCRQGLDVTGPHPADTLFHATARARYDVAIAMYHDQALIPIKTLAFDSGVNVTLGLPFVRTSPDHGTAFGIAGTGTASPESLIQAILLAGRMAAARAGAACPAGAP